MTRIRIERIRPKGGLMFDEKALNRGLVVIGNLVASSMRRQANQTVRTWRKKPRISTRRATKGTQFFIILDIDSIIWQFLDKGTKPHVIKAKKKPFLAFRQGGFIAKTKVNQFASGTGASATGGLRMPKQVMHPGFPARNWSKEIVKRNQALASRETVKLLDRAVKKRKVK